MRKPLPVLTALAALAACSPGTPEPITGPRAAADTAVAPNIDRAGGPAPDAAAPAFVVASIDLTAVTNDRITVVVDPGTLADDTVLFRLPRVVQGTYAVSDFGGYVDTLTAVDVDGTSMSVERIDTNTWRIADAPRLGRVSYLVNDTFDQERSLKDGPFSPSGTNIDPEIYVLNLHGFVGYFEGMTEEAYEVRITAPATMARISALPLAATDTSGDGSKVTDRYRAERYFQVTDNPMMYGDFQEATFRVQDIDIVVSLYSPTGAHDIGSIAPSMESMMDAQRAYLGDFDTPERYDVYIFLAGQGPEAPTGFGALEHHTSTVVVMPEAIPTEMLNNYLIDIVSHEFFHIVSPLRVHSEDVHDFDYYAPTFSEHLWMYEGQTEYFASHFQVYQGLEAPEAFYEKMAGKVDNAAGYDDAMSFTAMSENIIDEPYASNYANVYEKGALIGMCLDVILRAESGGERSLIGVMQELSSRYGVERPFEDDAIIDEITAMTYPEVGAFLATHVVGDIPIDYDECLAPVGLEVATDRVPSALLFLDQQTPFIDGNPATGELFFRSVALNSTLEAIGVEGGDVIRSFNGTAYDLSNVQALAQASMALTPDSEITLVVEREGEEIELSGVLGTPTVGKTAIRPLGSPTPEQTAIWKAWLNQP
jgi:predicted metalloprotease with PDZ domain